jgi:hypothetical protein
MNRGEFEGLMKSMVDRETKLLLQKRKEYAGDDDVLVNFKQIAPILGCEPEDVAVMYLMKHIQSVCHGAKRGDPLVWANTDGSEGILQKITDARNYLLLLAAIISENQTRFDEEIVQA